MFLILDYVFCNFVFTENIIQSLFLLQIQNFSMSGDRSMFPPMLPRLLVWLYVSKDSSSFPLSEEDLGFRGSLCRHRVDCKNWLVRRDLVVSYLFLLFNIVSSTWHQTCFDRWGFSIYLLLDPLVTWALTARCKWYRHSTQRRRRRALLHLSLCWLIDRSSIEGREHLLPWCVSRVHQGHL